MASSSGTYNPARPKRAGEQFTRTHHLDIDEPSTKKPRFDPRNPSTLAPDAEDEEDPALEADVIGKTSGIKRNAVNIDGYDSDSSTENFDARAEAQFSKKEKPSKDDDDDDDMFADEDKDDNQDEASLRTQTKKKQLRFLDNDEIEGQEENSKSGGHVAVDFTNGPKSHTKDVESSSEEGDDEERDRVGSDMDEELGAGSKKKHAPKLDAFNMRAEQEEGRFDEAGNFVRKAFDPEAAQDSWLEGISKKDMKKAKEAHDKREAELKARERAEDSIVTSDVLSDLIMHLEVGETPMEALVRYGKAAPKKKPTSNWAKKKKQQQQAMEVDVDPAQEAVAAKAKQAIDLITECASRLSDRGVEDIYELPRESIMRQYKRETGEDWKNPHPEAVQWEFHWLNAPEDDINGPYDQATMQAWEASGQFAAGAEFRRVGETEWSRLLDFED